MSAIKYLVGEDNSEIKGFLAMISESFNISEDIYNDEDINLMEDGLNVLNSLELRAKMILIMDTKVIDNSKDILSILQIDESVVKKVDNLFNLIIEKNSEKILDFFEENPDFTLKDYTYLTEYFDIDLSSMQKRKDDDKIAQLDELEEDLKGIYKSMLLSKDFIKRELDKSMNTSSWKSSFLDKNLPYYSSGEVSYEEYEEVEDYFENEIQNFRGYFDETMGITRNNTEQGINNITKIVLSEYNERKKIINSLLSNINIKDIIFDFKKFRFNIDIKRDINLPTEVLYPRIKVRSKLKKKIRI